MLRSLWRHFRPGLLAALALVLIVGGCLAISSTGPSSSGASPGSGSSPGYGAAAPATGAAPPPASTSPTWTGLLRVTTAGIDMSVQPPTLAQGQFDNTTVAYSPDQQTLYVGSGPAAIWPSPTDPTVAQCQAQVQTQSLSPTEAHSVPYRQGQGLCIVAYQQKAMAFVRGSDPPGGQAVQMRGIRWPNPQ